MIYCISGVPRADILFQTLDKSMMYNVHRGIYSYEIKTHVKSILGEFWENMKAIAKKNKLEAQWAEPVSLTFHSALRKLYTEPSMVLPTKFRFIWSSVFRGEDLFKSTNQKQELSVVAMFVNGSQRNKQSL